MFCARGRRLHHHWVRQVLFLFSFWNFQHGKQNNLVSALIHICSQFILNGFIFMLVWNVAFVYNEVSAMARSGEGCHMHTAWTVGHRSTMAWGNGGQMPPCTCSPHTLSPVQMGGRFRSGAGTPLKTASQSTLTRTQWPPSRLVVWASVSPMSTSPLCSGCFSIGSGCRTPKMFLEEMKQPFLFL